MKVLAPRIQRGDRILHGGRVRVVTQSCAPLGGDAWCLGWEGSDDLHHFPYGAEVERTETAEDALIRAMFGRLAEQP